MAKLSVPIKRTVQKYHSQGWSASQLAKEIETEYNVLVSREAINRFLFYYQTTRSLVTKSGSEKPTKITDTVLHAVEAKMQADDETTAMQLAYLLSQCGLEGGHFMEHDNYCQLICEANKEKHLVWATKCLDERDTFDDAILSDKTSVQLEFHKRHCFHKANQPLKLKPKPKHPVKVHVWAGISKYGATEIYI